MTSCTRSSARNSAGARIYVVADSCHSGSVARYASAPAEPDSAPLKARFLPPYVFARGNRLFERAIDRAINTPAPTKLRYPAVLFSGCHDTEFSYDTSFNGRPNGAFTRVAIDALQDASIATPRALVRRCPAEASRTVTAADPATVREPRRQAGSLVLMTEPNAQDGRKHTRVSGMGGAVLSLRPLQQARRTGSVRRRPQRNSRGRRKRGDVRRRVSRPRVRRAAHRAARRRAGGIGVARRRQQRRSGDPRAVSALGVRCLPGTPLRARDGRSGHHGLRLGRGPSAVRRRPPVRHLRRPGDERCDRAARAERRR